MIICVNIMIILKVEIETGQAHGGSPRRPVCGRGRCLCLSQEVLGNFDNTDAYYYNEDEEDDILRVSCCFLVE